MKCTSAISRWVRHSFTWYFSAKVVLAILIFAVSAASITASTTNYQAELGSAYNVSNNLLVGDKGLSKPSVGTGATGSCPAATVTFSGSPGPANNALPAGDPASSAPLHPT